jgi:hypothetical protein
METEKKIINKELRKKYNETFINKHKGEKTECKECGYKYSIFNKSYHKKSKIHLNIIELKKQL